MVRNIASTSAAALALLATSVVAHSHGGTPVDHERFLKRQGSGTTDAASQATETNPTTECTAYYVAEVSALIYNYPTVWGTADILANDTDARNLYNSIEPSIPTDVAVKAGTRAGDFSNVTYSSSDPDCWWTYGQAGSKCSVPKHSGIPTDITICDEPRTWGLSFDDGPNCTHNAFYDYLQSKNQKATMCYIGSNVLNWPYQAQRGLTDGHHIISHTWSHPYMTALTNTEVFAELYYSTKAIKEVTGVTVEAWRPPYGDVDDRVRAIATGLGLSTVLWSADTDDWMVEPEGTLPRSTIESNYATIINNVSDTIGNIVLTHEINADTMDIAMEQYPNITAKYSHVVPLQACLNWTKPYQEDITYPDFADYIAGTTMASGLPATGSITIASATYSPLNGGGSSVVVNEQLATSSGSSGSKASSGSGSSGSSGASSDSSKSSAADLFIPAAGLLSAIFIGAGAVLAA